MKKQALFTFIITLMLTSLLCIPMFAYTVNIGGVLLDRSGLGVSGKIIFFKSLPNDALLVDTSLLTMSGGFFTLSIETSSDIARGTITVSVDGCNSSTSIHFDSEHTDKKIRLLDCQGSSQRCAVRIGANRIDSAIVELTAFIKGHGGASYSWSTGDTSEIIQVLQPGTYCVKVEDSTGCIASDCITVGHPSCKTEIHVVQTDINVTDAISNKAFVLTARTKGKAPFSYLWSTGDTSMQIQVGNAELYCVTVVDATGCRSNDCKIVRGVGCAVKIQIEQDDSLGSSTATVLSVRASGLPPFSYQWSTGETTSSIHTTGSTWYCVKVVDSLGCISRDCMDLSRQCDTEIRVGPNTNNLSDGGHKVLYAITKGRAPFHFRWSTGDTTQRIVVDTAGEYCVEVTDDKGCESSACVMVRFPPLCSAKIQLVPKRQVSDAVTSAFMLAVRTYGHPPFKYVWSTGDTTQQIEITDVAEYCVTVTDVAGCSVQDCLDLSNFSDSCSVKIHRTHNGHLIAFARPNFSTTFYWSTGDTSRHIKIDSAGEYCLTATNMFGCTTSTCITIPADHDSLCGVKILRRKVAEGTLLIAAHRGLGDFSFTWSTGDTSRYILVDSAGAYCLTAFTNTCEVQTCIDVNDAANTQGIGSAVDHHIFSRKIRTKLFPNPFKQLLYLSLSIDQPQLLEIFVHRLDGKLIYRDKIGLGVGAQTIPVDLQGTPDGIYIVKIRGKDTNETFRMVKHGS